MKIRFLGAARTVTGSFFVLESGESRFAVDCGLYQGPKDLKERNYSTFPVDPASLDFLILTHAHIDHSGLLPKLCTHGFKGDIYCTFATAELAAIMLPDSAYIQTSEVERKNRKLKRADKPPLKPIYTVEDAQRCLEQFRPLNYDEVFSPRPDLDIRLRDAGHILGSAMVEIWVKEDGVTTKVVFSGDLGNYNQRIIKDPTFIENADYLVLESTYGNRLHQGGGNRIEDLLDAINSTIGRGGNLVIPSFAVERTQDLIYDLNLLHITGRLPADIPVYVDSPLAVAATEVFRRSTQFFDRTTMNLLKEGSDPFNLPNLRYSLTQQDSMRLNTMSGAIIISASGMCDAGRIKHHLKYNLWRPESTILFVGFQAEGTLGRRLLDGEKRVAIHGEQVAVKAEIRRMESYSAHADQAGIIEWLKHFTTPPRRVFLVHGEETAQMRLRELIENNTGMNVIIPNWLDQFDLAREEEAAVPARTRPAAVTAENLAAKAEEAYLRFQMRANSFFQDQWRARNYEKLLCRLDLLEKTLNDANVDDGKR